MYLGGFDMILAGLTSGVGNWALWLERQMPSVLNKGPGQMAILSSPIPPQDFLLEHL